MTATDRSLPEGFQSLEPFVERFAIHGSANRAQLRSDCSLEEMTAFFNAISPLAASALDLLDRKPVDQLDPAEQRLMNLLLSLAHVALAVETHGDAEAQHAVLRSTMRITRTPADMAA